MEEEDNYIVRPNEAEKGSLQGGDLTELELFAQAQLAKVKQLAKIALALSAERDLGRLLEMIIQEARNLTNADGGTLYLMSEDETKLLFAIIQNDTLNIRMGGTGGKITWPPVNLTMPDGTPNYANVSAYAALSGKVINISDVYNAPHFNFDGTRHFDEQTGFRSRSMLVVPMRDHENNIIGVLQLINALHPITKEVVDFSLGAQELAEALASQAAIAVSNKRLIFDLENLLEAVVKTFASAIDEKSPYTGGHVRRVADLTQTLALAIHNATEGVFKDVRFTEDQLKELRIAAWLHDVGKITVPEYVIDKATRLETIYDRIELIKTRMEVIKRDLQIAALRRMLPEGRSAETDLEEVEEATTLNEYIQFISRLNRGIESLSTEQKTLLNKIQALTWKQEGKEMPLLTEDEIFHLSIPYGTLTSAERAIITDHVAVTARMLAHLPFPKKLKKVAEIASSHHEKLNGTGYPTGKKREELSLQARIIALADIFEAITARDRPYKKANTLSQTIEIIKTMVQKGELDGDIFDLFLKEKLYLDYAQRELYPEQIDQTDFAD